MKYFSVLLLIIIAGNAPAYSCDFSSANILESAESPDAFFGRPLGAVAIGEQCDPSTNICEKNVDITACADVLYPVMTFGDPSISIVINTSKGCKQDESCPTENSYLAAAAVYINNEDSRRNLPTIEVIRNEGWHKPRSFERGYRIALDQIIDDDKVPIFFEIQAKRNSILTEFERKVVTYFHATPFSGAESSWSMKRVFGEAFSRTSFCRGAQNLCSLKSYLMRFTETERGVPGSALRINAALARADGIHIDSFSPAAGSIYNKGITIHFKWPAPLPRPRPMAALGDR